MSVTGLRSDARRSTQAVHSSNDSGRRWSVRQRHNPTAFSLLTGHFGPAQHPMAAALFDRIDVLGMREATVHLSARAVRHGLAAVLPAEFDSPVGGRGERSQTDRSDLNVPLSLNVELTGAEKWQSRVG